MKKTITINNVVYKTAEIDFNAVCSFEEMGVPITDAKGHDMSLLRAYLALCMGKPMEVAGKELETHIVGGGEITELATALSEAVEESGFFQALRKGKETEATAVETKKTSKVKE